MTKILVVGCGDLGGEVATLLYALGYDVAGVRFSNKPLTNSDITCIQADVTQAKSLTILEQTNPSIVIYCVAANTQSDESYRTHYVEGLRNVLATQKQNEDLKHVFFVSSTRVYGQVVDQVLDETVRPIAADFGGERLLEAEALLNDLACGATSIRLSGIYGPGRLYMVNLAKQPERWATSNKWTNRLHRDDAARFIAFLSEKVIAGEIVERCYIGTDSMPTLQHEVLQWLAKKLDIAIPARPVDAVVSGKRLSNHRMLASGFKLTYPNYKLGYSSILKEKLK